MSRRMGDARPAVALSIIAAFAGDTAPSNFFMRSGEEEEEEEEEEAIMRWW